ncbi:MAG: amidohydrolase family protein [Pseudomonadota bacterium]
MRIDAHQHFWKLERGDYGWLTSDLAPIYRDFLPGDLAPTLEKHGIEGTILVQAAPTVAESEFMLSLANETPFVKGVVGWIDFESPSAVNDLDSLAANSALVGLRPMIQDIDNPNWMLCEDLAPAFDAMIAADLTFDALTLPIHLDNLKTLLARYPGMRTVIDHGSKPEIRNREFKIWAGGMAALAKESTAYCKLSGLVTEAQADWSTEDLKPYVDHLLATFGPSRLIWGSDWPVCALASSYDRWVETTETLLADLNEVERNAILGGTAARAYKLENAQ